MVDLLFVMQTSLRRLLEAEGRSSSGARVTPSGDFIGVGLPVQPRSVKPPAQSGAASPDRGAAGPPGFADCFRAFDDEFAYVCRTLRRHGVSGADVEDVAQDVLVVVWRRWADFDRGRPLRPWLTGIATWVARDFLRRRWREIPQEHVELADPRPAGEDQLEEARLRRLFISTLARLPDRHRIAIVLHDLEGLAPREIAQAMGVPLSTAYTRLSRAHLAFGRELVRLRERIKPASWPSRARRTRIVLGAALAAAAATVLALCLDTRPPSANAPLAAEHRTSPALRQGLVGYWPFDDAPGSRLAHDRSGHGRHCVLHDLDPRLVWTGGAVGGAVDLRAGGWLECPQPALPAGRPAPDMTVMIRVKTDQPPKAHGAVVTREMGPDHDDLFFFGFVGNRLKVSSRAWLGWVTRPIAPLNDRWTHLAFTRRSGGPTRLFLEGIEIGVNAQGERLVPAGGQTPLMVGGGHVGFDGSTVRQHFSGLVDDLAVYDRALGPEEIALAAAARTPLTL
jgi:RNA polymerase sigma-70 factor, ECF subfamily